MISSRDTLLSTHTLTHSLRSLCHHRFFALYKQPGACSADDCDDTYLCRLGTIHPSPRTTPSQRRHAVSQHWWILHLRVQQSNSGPFKVAHVSACQQQSRCGAHSIAHVCTDGACGTQEGPGTHRKNRDWRWHWWITPLVVLPLRVCVSLLWRRVSSQTIQTSNGRDAHVRQACEKVRLCMG